MGWVSSEKADEGPNDVTGSEPLSVVVESVSPCGSVDKWLGGEVWTFGVGGGAEEEDEEEEG